MAFAILQRVENHLGVGTMLAEDVDSAETLLPVSGNMTLDVSRQLSNAVVASVGLLTDLACPATLQLCSKFTDNLVNLISSVVERNLLESKIIVVHQVHVIIIGSDFQLVVVYVLETQTV